MQMLRLIRRVETEAKSGLSLEWLRPFMKETRRSAGDILFKRGDYADRLFVLLAGQIHLEQIDHVLNAGDLFGEIGLFSTDHQRTQTARAFTDVELLWISESELVQVCYENPGISFYFLRLTTNRLIPMHHAIPGRRPQPCNCRIEPTVRHHYEQSKICKSHERRLSQKDNRNRGSIAWIGIVDGARSRRTKRRVPQ